MILRKMVGIIFCALLSPIAFSIRWLPNVIKAILYEKYEYYDSHVTTLRQFLSLVYHASYIEVFLSLFFIFLPFELIKHYRYEKNYDLSFLKKIGILSGIVVLLILAFGSFSNIWVIPWYKNFVYLIFAICFGLFFGTILHFMVDRYQKKKP